ncbi:MAG: hypothetical protein Q4P28_03765 [Tissierellia bacterium]|nr:hypothetical protein [Tissierellia bacterium]
MRKYARYFREDGDEAGKNISWSAIFAGVVTFLAIFMTFSLIGSAIGLGIASPTEANPMDGVGTGVTIWTVITFILSFICAGFVAGITAQRVGLVHGFLTWATTSIAMVLILALTATSLLSGAASILGSIASVTGEGVAKVAEGTGNITSEAFDQIKANVNVDTDELQDNLEQTLRDTDQEELQPEYLQNQMNEAVTEIGNAAKEVVTNPENADQVIDNLVNDLKQRAETIGNAADRDAIASAVAKNSDLTEEEAEEATDNIYNGLQKASQEAQVKLEEASQKIEELKVQAEQTIDDARETAEDVTNTGAKASVWGFVAMVLSLILTSVFGLIGANLVKDPTIRRKM